MRNLKRFMSGSMATLMIALALMTGASAKSFDDVASSDVYAEQIEILSDIGVIKGTSETEFSPDEMVTREQMALLLFRLMIGKDTAGKTNSTSFTDLYDDTYHGAISWANASGYIIGTSETTFEPTEGIMLQDAMTMLVRALGHETAQMNKGYPWTYIDTAVGLGLDAGLEKVGYEEELTRAEVAAILYNAISAEYLIPKTAPNGMTYYEATTIIERVFGYDIDESVIVATNSHALEGVSTVTKDGYITVHTDAGLLTVKYDELGLDGSADAHLGKSFKLVYKRDDKTKLVSVLGCTELGRSTAAEIIDIDEKKYSYVEIDGVKYQVVQTLSDELATNANELLVYAYSDTDTLVQITSNEELSALTGAFDAHLIYDSKTSDIADRLIIKPFSFDKLSIEDGRVNIADDMDIEDLTVIDPDKAEDGDYVLYYFNSESGILEIAAVLTAAEEATVTRLTSDTATIGGKRYELGCEKLGVSPSSIRERLSVGEKVNAVIYGSMILAVESSSVSTHAPSKYLVADSGVTPVFSDGKLNYAMDAIIDGVTETIIVTNRTVTDGSVYRYTVNEKGIYTLIPARISGGSIVSGDEEFIQSDKHNDELAFIVDSADGTTVEKSSSHYTLSSGSAEAVTSAGTASSVRFVTDKNTMILVMTDGEWKLSKGIYTSTITVNDGASVTAVFANEVGSVETLRYLFLTDGALGSVDATATTVKIIANAGKELVDGTVYSIYTVLDLASGELVTMNSKSASLTVGGNYLTDMNGLISTTEAGATVGVVSGYTSATVTVGDTTYKLASDVKFLEIEDLDTVKELKLEDIFMDNVELVITDGEVKSVIFLGKAEFDAVHADGTVTVTSKHNLTDADSLQLVALTHYDSTEDETTDLDIDDFTADVTDGTVYAFEVTSGEALEAGEYTLVFKVNGIRFIAEFTV